jgi:hypothetical protein
MSQTPPFDKVHANARGEPSEAASPIKTKIIGAERTWRAAMYWQIAFMSVLLRMRNKSGGVMNRDFCDKDRR